MPFHVPIQHSAFYMNKNDIEKLSDKITSGIANDEEILLYNRLCNSFDNNNWEWDDNVHGTKASIEASIKKTIWSKIKFRQKPASIISISRRFAAAAAVLLVFLSVYFIYKSTSKQPDLAKIVTQKQRFKNDVPPGTDKAILTLADGSTIVLDDEDNGTLTTQGSTKVLKFNGKVSYQTLQQSSQEILFNTISTPRGGQYQVVLPDGSTVWLNAASSIRFPTVFQGNDRKVEVAGEVYFEIIKDKLKPFIVSVNKSEIEVLGTHFNVMAYEEEGLLKTTLLEGSVKFVNGRTTKILVPGQQAQLIKDGLVAVASGVNVENVMAWKNGVFQFEGEDIGTVTRQLSRWYDVEVEYSRKVGDLFYAEMPRNTKLSDALKALELTGKVHFEIDGRKIIVHP